MKEGKKFLYYKTTLLEYKKVLFSKLVPVVSKWEKIWCDGVVIFKCKCDDMRHSSLIDYNLIGSLIGKLSRSSKYRIVKNETGLSIDADLYLLFRRNGSTQQDFTSKDFYWDV